MRAVKCRFLRNAFTPQQRLVGDHVADRVAVLLQRGGAKADRFALAGLRMLVTQRFITETRGELHNLRILRDNEYARKLFARNGLHGALDERFAAKLRRELVFAKASTIS